MIYLSKHELQTALGEQSVWNSRAPTQLSGLKNAEK